MNVKMCNRCGTEENLFKDRKGKVYSICLLCRPLMLKERSIKSRDTMIKNYGVTNPSQLQSVKDKKKETTLRNFGVEYPMQSTVVQETLKQENKKKYGVENVSQVASVKESKKKSCLDHFGVECNLSLLSNQEAVKKTMIKLYGVENPSQSPLLQEQKAATNLEIYGSTSPAGNEKVQQKTKNTNIVKYGVETPLLNPEVKHKIKITTKTNYWEEYCLRLERKGITPFFDKGYFISLPKVYKLKCLKCDSEIETEETNPQRIRCSCTRNASLYEYEISLWLQSIGIMNIVNNKRFMEEGVYKYEIDIFLPDFNLGIDFHGLYWHSSDRKENNYHQKKHLYFKENNIKYIQVFENEWLFKKDIFQSIIMNRLGLITEKIYARECVIREVISKDAKLFLEINHLQGSVKSAINIGLYYKEELVCISTFSKNRFDKEDSMELLRFTNKLNLIVIGGFNKILSYFEKIYKPKTLISFVDLRYFSGSSYSKNGFTFKHMTAPNYFYFKINDPNYELHSRLKFQKHKLEKILEIFDPLKSEHANMEDNNYLRIYDAGNLKFFKSYN